MATATTMLLAGKRIWFIESTWELWISNYNVLSARITQQDLKGLIFLTTHQKQKPCKH